MKTRKRTNVTMIVDGAQREIFSLIERRNDGFLNGEAVLILKRPGDWGDGVCDESEINQLRFSLHPSFNGPKDTPVFTHTLAIGKPELKETRATVKFARPDGLWHLFSIRCSDISIDHYRINNKSKGNILVLDNYSTKTACLCYSVFVSLDPIDTRNVSLGGMSFKTIELSNFHVLIIARYMNVPSDQFGDIYTPSTSSPVYDKAISPNHRSGTGISWPISNITNELIKINVHLSMRYVTRLKRLALSANQQFDDQILSMIYMSLIATPRPLFSAH